jgi:hypothetical protein
MEFLENQSGNFLFLLFSDIIGDRGSFIDDFG